MKGRVQAAPGPIAPTYIGLTITHESVLSTGLRALSFPESYGG